MLEIEDAIVDIQAAGEFPVRPMGQNSRFTLMEPNTGELEAIEQESRTEVVVFPPEKIESQADIDAIMGDSLSMHIYEVSKYPLLTGDEEKSLFKQILTARSAKKEMAGGKTDKKRLAELTPQLEAGFLAENTLVTRNCRLVIANAKKYADITRSTFPELISAGYVGLIRGAKKFNYRRKDTKFSTYVTWWIRQSIFREMTDNGRIIQRPVEQYFDLKQISEAKRFLINRYGRQDIGIVEIAAFLEWSPKRVEFVINHRHDASEKLDEPKVTGDPGSDETLIETLGDEFDTVEKAESNLARQDLLQSLKNLLTNKQFQAFVLMTGLFDDIERSSDEVAQILNTGVGAAAIRFQKIEAIRAIKRGLEADSGLRRKFEEYGINMPST